MVRQLCGAYLSTTNTNVDVIAGFCDPSIISTRIFITNKLCKNAIKDNISSFIIIHVKAYTGVIFVWFPWSSKCLFFAFIHCVDTWVTWWKNLSRSPGITRGSMEKPNSKFGEYYQFTLSGHLQRSLITLKATKIWRQFLLFSYWILNYDFRE